MVKSWKKLKKLKFHVALLSQAYFSELLFCSLNLFFFNSLLAKLIHHHLTIFAKLTPR